MSTQVKRVKIYTKNHSARIKTRTNRTGTVSETATFGREDGFAIVARTDTKGTGLYIHNVFEGGQEGVCLTGKQIRTLRRVLDRHFYGY